MPTISEIILQFPICLLHIIYEYAIDFTFKIVNPIKCEVLQCDQCRMFVDSNDGNRFISKKQMQRSRKGLSKRCRLCAGTFWGEWLWPYNGKCPTMYSGLGLNFYILDGNHYGRNYFRHVCNLTCKVQKNVQIQEQKIESVGSLPLNFQWCKGHSFLIDKDDRELWARCRRAFEINICSQSSDASWDTDGNGNTTDGDFEDDKDEQFPYKDYSNPVPQRPVAPKY